MINAVITAAAMQLLTSCATALKPIPLNKRALAIDFKNQSVKLAVFFELPVQI